MQNEPMIGQTGTLQIRFVGGLTLIWALYGAARFLAVQFGILGDPHTASAELAHFASYPIWASAFWALTVWGCIAGSAMLLLRSSWAIQAFVVAVIGLIGTSAYQLSLSINPFAFEAMPIAMATWIIAVASILFASIADNAGQLG
ncbi:hypothetical protein FGU71_01545 [Erythrobacter insulae]|uniref:Sugar transporter n=1 Tax=Erythrobacter insulae TaxID=2584124 RepID=A0A547P953_9SPHN|nr:hypothetical protein [Erythrobacter insulae]TRD10678.1 hypothetical protein FGU71_01545 [Erythrobacter insulae]